MKILILLTVFAYIAGLAHGTNGMGYRFQKSMQNRKDTKKVKELKRERLYVKIIYIVSVIGTISVLVIEQFDLWKI